MSTVAVVGLGAMGSRIAARLIDAGNQVVVWNRSPAKVDELVGLGAEAAERPADAARGNTRCPGTACPDCADSDQR